MSFSLAAVELGPENLVALLNSDDLYSIVQREGSALTLRRIYEGRLYQVLAATPVPGQHLTPEGSAGLTTRMPITQVTLSEEFLSGERIDVDVRIVRQMVIDFDEAGQPYARLLVDQGIALSFADLLSEENPAPVSMNEEVLYRQPEGRGCCGCFGRASN